MLKILIEMTVALNISGEVREYNQIFEIEHATKNHCEEVAYDVSSQIVNNSIKNTIEALNVIGVKSFLEDVKYSIHCE